MPSYLVVKSLHLISMVAWFAGLFYIFRLFVYHRANCETAAITSLLSTMEGKLLKIILWPASLATLGFGAFLIALNPLLLKQGWLHMKLALVCALFGYQILANIAWRRFKEQDFFLTEKQCRLINEFPTLILFAVVMLAVLKPAL